MKTRVFILLMILMANTAALSGCAALVGGAAGAAVYDAAEDELDD